MTTDRGWFKRQAIRAAEEFKELPHWLRTPRGSSMSEQERVLRDELIEAGNRVTILSAENCRLKAENKRLNDDVQHCLDTMVPIHELKRLTKGQETLMRALELSEDAFAAAKAENEKLRIDLSKVVNSNAVAAVQLGEQLNRDRSTLITIRDALLMGGIIK